MRPMRRMTAVPLTMFALAAGGVPLALAAHTGAAPVSKAKAVAFARLVNLRESDLVGAHAISARFSSNSPLRCQGKTRPVARKASGLIYHSDFAVSGVEVVPTDAIARVGMARLNSAAGRTCLAGLLGRGLRVEVEKTVTSHLVSIAFTSLEKAFGRDAFAASAVAELPATKETKAVTVYFGLGMFRVGPAEINLITESFGRDGPLASAIERRLLKRLHSRATAHKL